MLAGLLGPGQKKMKETATGKSMTSLSKSMILACLGMDERFQLLGLFIPTVSIRLVVSIHTSQGLEFDYVGVIIGKDLKFDPQTMTLYADYDEYKDTVGKKGLKKDPAKLTELVKNIYKVLLSRGMKGCYVYCRDRNLHNDLLERIQLTNS